MLSDALSYKSLPELAGYAPPCEHSLAGGGGLVPHCISGVVVVRATALAAWLPASISCAPTVERSWVEAEQNSDGFHGAMYFDIFLC